MTLFRAMIVLVLFCVLCTAGCTELSGTENKTDNSSGTSAPASIARYRLALAQPEDTAKMIRMDTDIYNPGEVVEFVIANEKKNDLSCKNNPPSFSVRYQRGSGQWVFRMGEENAAPGNGTSLKPGESTTPYRFVTEGWAPGRYRIVTDCGVSREILLRAKPSAALTPGPACPAPVNKSPFITINPVTSQYAGIPFTIAGTTSLGAGEELRYSIFAIIPSTGNITSAKLVSSSITVTAGSCGINSWSVDGRINVPGDYFIGISDSTNTVSAVRRFSVLPSAGPPATATLPSETNAPGISTK